MHAPARRTKGLADRHMHTHTSTYQLLHLAMQSVYIHTCMCLQVHAYENAAGVHTSAHWGCAHTLDIGCVHSPSTQEWYPCTCKKKNLTCRQMDSTHSHTTTYIYTYTLQRYNAECMCTCMHLYVCVCKGMQWVYTMCILILVSGNSLELIADRHIY